MRRTSLLLLTIAGVLIAGTLSAFQWAANNVIKFKVSPENPYASFLDYENISVKGNYVQASDPTNSWLRTYDVFTGEDFLPENAFVNIENSSTDSSLTLTVRDSISDEILIKKVFTQSGTLSLTNIFHKNIYLVAEFHGTNLQLFSLGFKRIPREVIKQEDFTIYPELCFYGMTNLTAQFKLHIPATIDMIVYDEWGTIVHYIVKQKYFTQGSYEVYWKPQEQADKDRLKSGSYFIYIRATSIDKKTIELSRKFLFIKN
ncbi:MAG: hypothetical protein A2Y33_01770 [Spirochaetes bacterium GWF1_51_8]|nr:MAG: hypothetical protein A2Y33_01770 [Spirochaetes bacterium GWF1_51_8]